MLAVRLGYLIEDFDLTAGVTAARPLVGLREGDEDDRDRLAVVSLLSGRRQNDSPGHKHHVRVLPRIGQAPGHPWGCRTDRRAGLP